MNIEKYYCNSSYLNDYSGNVDLDSFNKLQDERNEWLLRESSNRYLEALENIDFFGTKYKDFAGDSIKIGKKEELTDENHEAVQNAIKTFMPWRKGPLDFFDTHIDAEWKSHWKWNRIAPHLDGLEDKAILDIGCNNGYYMYKMAAQNPALVMGIDPVVKYYLKFRLLNGFACQKNLHFEMMGVEHLDMFTEMFDVIFCMGILYHHADPIGIIRNIWKALKPDGQMIIETQGIEGDEPYALFPDKRYAKVPNTYFVPTEKCLELWIKRGGYKDINCFFNEKLSTDEQRKTDFVQYQSLQDFLDPDDSSKTIEGYPAPHRIYFSARKRNN